MQRSENARTEKSYKTVDPEFIVRDSKQDLKTVKKQSLCRRKQPRRSCVYDRKNTATRAAAVSVRWQVVLVFLFSAVALGCPSGRGGAVSSFSVCTFFCIRWIQSRAHGLESMWAAQRPRPTILSQLERTRAVHVTSQNKREAPEGGRGRSWLISQFSLIIYETHLLSCHTSRREGCFVLSDRYKHRDLLNFVYTEAVKMWIYL